MFQAAGAPHCCTVTCMSSNRALFWDCDMFYGGHACQLCAFQRTYQCACSVHWESLSLASDPHQDRMLIPEFS